jgi:hypothetical protein
MHHRISRTGVISGAAFLMPDIRSINHQKP